MNAFIKIETRRLLVAIAVMMIFLGFFVALAETRAAVADSVNEKTTSGDIEDTALIPSSEVPRAGGNVNTSIPNGDEAMPNIALPILAAICLTAVSTLGFSWIKRKRSECKKRTGTKKSE
jgi:hypothetical protein